MTYRTRSILTTLIPLTVLCAAPLPLAAQDQKWEEIAGSSSHPRAFVKYATPEDGQPDYPRVALYVFCPGPPEYFKKTAVSIRVEGAGHDYQSGPVYFSGSLVPVSWSPGLGDQVLRPTSEDLEHLPELPELSEDVPDLDDGELLLRLIAWSDAIAGVLGGPSEAVFRLKLDEAFASDRDFRLNLSGVLDRLRACQSSDGH